jgi:hypothetical protein
MADLQMVQMDNILYVTTPKRATQLQAEQKKAAEESLPRRLGVDPVTGLPLERPETPQQSGKTQSGSM